MNKKFMYQMALVLFGILLVLIIFTAAVFNMIREKKNETADVATAQTEQSGFVFYEEESSLKYVDENESQNVPNFGTIISNLDRYVVPLLKDNSYMLEESLKEFLPEVVTAEIFYVIVPEEDKDKTCFFVKTPDEEQVVVLTYSWMNQEVEASWSEYTEDEILSEVWNGSQPQYRDEEE